MAKSIVQSAAPRLFLASLSLGFIACLGVAFYVHATETRTVPRPQVFSVREFELKSGVKPEEFEALARREFSQGLSEDKIASRFRLLKGDRGDRKGHYLLVWEFDSVGTRNEYFPKEGRGCRPDFEHNWKRIKLSLEKLSAFLKEKNSYTDYVSVTD